MVDPRDLFEALNRFGVRLYAGVPDSLLKYFCAWLTHQDSMRHIITANEGAAVALGAGHYLATNELAVVYMQNSGLGNAVNPLVSLTDPSVYGIPLLLLIGWRGEPGRVDEPQHLFQGRKTIALLETLEIPHTIVDASTTDIQKVAQIATTIAREMSRPYALVVREGTFKAYGEEQSETEMTYPLTREEAIKISLKSIGETPIVVATTGMASREIFECRGVLRHRHDRDFLTIGSMGHASQIALGIALSMPEKEIFCLDGDGAVIMHMGALAIIGSTAPKNFRHIILNNGAHDSVGGQLTAGFTVNFCAIASACGYVDCRVAQAADDISEAIRSSQFVRGPTLLEINVKKGAREDLGRPTISPSESKIRFMKSLRK